MLEVTAPGRGPFARPPVFGQKRSGDRRPLVRTSRHAGPFSHDVARGRFIAFEGGERGGQVHPGTAAGRSAAGAGLAVVTNPGTRGHSRVPRQIRKSVCCPPGGEMTAEAEALLFCSRPRRSCCALIAQHSRAEKGDLRPLRRFERVLIRGAGGLVTKRFLALQRFRQWRNATATG